jgi:hypothetical protein
MNVLDKQYTRSLLQIGTADEQDDGYYFCKLTYNKMPFMIKTNRVCFYKRRPQPKDNMVAISIASKEYLEWFDQFYHDCIELFHTRSKDWFEDPLTLSDVEFSFINPLKSNIKHNCFDVICETDANRLIVLDTRDNGLLLDELDDANVVPTFHVKGIKFNSKNFMFDIELNHLYVLLPEDLAPPTQEKPRSVENEVVANIPLENEATHVDNEQVNDVVQEEDDDDDANESQEDIPEEVDLEELNEPVDDDDLEIQELSVFSVYEKLNEKFKRNMVDHVRQLFLQKKISTRLNLFEILNDEEDEDA